MVTFVIGLDFLLMEGPHSCLLQQSVFVNLSSLITCFVLVCHPKVNAKSCLRCHPRRSWHGQMMYCFCNVVFMNCNATCQLLFDVHMLHTRRRWSRSYHNHKIELFQHLRLQHVGVDTVDDLNQNMNGYQADGNEKNQKNGDIDFCLLRAQKARELMLFN